MQWTMERVSLHYYYNYMQKKKKTFQIYKYYKIHLKMKLEPIDVW